MPNTREKLIELLYNFYLDYNGYICDGCGTQVAEQVCGTIADHLIANGVTVQQEESIYAKYANAMRDETMRLVERYLENINRIPKVATVQKWIPVTERLPEKDVKVLTFGVYGFSVNYRCRFSGKWRGVNGRSQWITHWMPLPEPPKGE